MGETMNMQLKSEETQQGPSGGNGDQPAAIHCNIEELYYGDFLAVRRQCSPRRNQTGNGLHRSVRLRERVQSSGASTG